MPRRLISRAELARIAGVTPAAITKACKGPLAAACVGRRVDLDHETAVQYLANRGRKAPAAEPISTPATPATPKPNQGATPEAGPLRVVQYVVDDVAEIADLTLREIGRRFGTKTAFRDWLLALKQIEDIREKRLRNEQSEGSLIPREPVRAYVFGAIDAANRRLLSDAPKTIARRVYAFAKSGVPIEQAEETVREIIGSQLRSVKTQAAKVLRGGE